MTNLITRSNSVTMSSREIADLVGARHNDVVATIERLFEKGLLRSSRESRSIATGGRPIMVYDLIERDTYLVTAGYSDEMRARIVDRWQDLENTVESAKLVDVRDAMQLFKPFFEIAELIGCDKQAASISANQAVLTVSGTNVLQIMGRTHIEASNQEALYFTPTELGRRIGTSARGMNLLLAEAGFQMKRGEHWEVTDTGRDFARIYDTGKKHGSGVPIQQIKWSAEVISALGKVAA